MISLAETTIAIGSSNKLWSGVTAREKIFQDQSYYGGPEGQKKEERRINIKICPKNCFIGQEMGELKFTNPIQSVL